MFKDNLEYINKHNEEAAQGKHTFTLGVSKFADVTHTEWKESLNVRKSVKDTHPAQISKPNANRPDSVDWRDEVSHFLKLYTVLITASILIHKIDIVNEE